MASSPIQAGCQAEAGASPAAGSVEKGNTVCDFDPLEKEYRHSLNSAIVNFAWKNVHIHLIDLGGVATIYRLQKRTLEGEAPPKPHPLAPALTSAAQDWAG